MSARRGARAHVLSFLLAAIAIAVLLAGSAISMRTTERLAASIASVSHTQQVLEHINRLWGLLGDRDSDLLRYLLAGDAASLQEFRRNARAFETSLASLAELTQDNAVHQRHLRRLRQQHVERLARNEELIRLKARAGSDAEASAAFATALDPARGVRYSETMRAELDAMAAHETSLLEARRAERRRMLAANRQLVLGANAVALLFGLAAVVLWRRLRRREDDALRAEAGAREAEAAARDRQALVDLLSHDLRQHFGNVQFAAGLLRSAEPDARAALVDTATSAANSGLLFLDAVLEQAAAEARGEPARALRLAAAVEAAVAGQAAQAARKGVALVARVDPQAAIRAQPAMLQHVLANLLSNAVKYGPADAAVEIEGVREGDIVRVRVLDRGPGVPAAERPRLFRRFAPLSARPTGGESTTGLGLVLARQRMRALGGDLRYEDRDGGGACFVAEAPAVPPPDR